MEITTVMNPKTNPNSLFLFSIFLVLLAVCGGDTVCAGYFTRDPDTSSDVSALVYSPPSTGNIEGITILVDFDDCPSTWTSPEITPADVNTYLKI